ncbi:MAG: tonB-system energizer ExbB [Rhizobiales bacterium]|nr:tonB-system energizer ExbB [Hyphomicrobiales bacterium]
MKRRLFKTIAASLPSKRFLSRIAVGSIFAMVLFVVQSSAFAHQAKAEAGSVAQDGDSAVTSAAPPADGSAGERPAAKAAVASAIAAAGEGNSEISILALVKRADVVVQFVIGALIFASLACWTVFLSKTFELSRARRRLVAALQALEHARFPEDIGIGSHSNASMRATVLRRLAEAAVNEKRLSEGLVDDRSVIDRYLTRAGEIVRTEARHIARGTGLLATIGAIAPFVGLFGTVWGIMNSFIGISRAQTTNLAVVAPGIVEALLATAIGLVAAIPAVIFYNLLARGTKAYVEQVGEGSGMVVRLLSRDLARPERVYAARAAE